MEQTSQNQTRSTLLAKKAHGRQSGSRDGENSVEWTGLMMVRGFSGRLQVCQIVQNGVFMMKSPRNISRITILSFSCRAFRSPPGHFVLKVLSTPQFRILFVLKIAQIWSSALRDNKFSPGPPVLGVKPRFPLIDSTTSSSQVYLSYSFSFQTGGSNRRSGNKVTPVMLSVLTVSFFFLYFRNSLSPTLRVSTCLIVQVVTESSITPAPPVSKLFTVPLRLNKILCAKVLHFRAPSTCKCRGVAHFKWNKTFNSPFRSLHINTSIPWSCS
jgi:hypothetical protein